jgi:ABC-type sugar transport system ATPase subunit
VKITENSPSISKSLGIAAIYQQPALFPELTVAENIAIGQEGSGTFSAWSTGPGVSSEPRNCSIASGQRINPETDCCGSINAATTVGRDRALRLDRIARVLILDEPTCIALRRRYAQSVSRYSRASRVGVGMIYISHRLEELPAIADR